VLRAAGAQPLILRLKEPAMRIGFMLLTVGAALASATPAAHAADVIVGYTGNPAPTNRTDGGQVVGNSFNSFGQTINSLGFFDYQMDGIADTYQLGLWDSSGNLLGTATVTPSSPLVGDFRWANMAAPVTIGTPSSSASFTIGVLLPANQQDVWLDDVSLTLGSGYSGAGTGKFSGPSGVLVRPTNFDDNGYYVVNGSDMVVPTPAPEPMTVGLLGAGALLLLRRRR
jgi:hypothetical protein